MSFSLLAINANVLLHFSLWRRLKLCIDTSKVSWEKSTITSRWRSTRNVSLSTSCWSTRWEAPCTLKPQSECVPHSSNAPAYNKYCVYLYYLEVFTRGLFVMKSTVMGRYLGLISFHLWSSLYSYWRMTIIITAHSKNMTDGEIL